MLATNAPGMGEGSVMVAVRKRGSVRLTRWVLIPLAAAVSLLGLAAPAGASGSPSAAAPTLANVVSVASAPTGHSVCAVLSTGHVVCWGDNQEGELGNGTTTDSDVPVAAAGITKAKTVIADESGTFCALLSTGHVACWGEGTSGQLGNGTITNSDVPVAVKTIGTAAALTGGQFGFCALLPTGHVDCWGNGGGALGNGTWTAYSDVPVAVSGISNAAAVTGGPDDFCALLSTGDVDCWGYGEDGELGDGTTTSSNVPVAVQTISNATSVTADYLEGTFCAVLSTGDVDCWGSNSSGQLGDGDGTTNSDVPVAATGVSAATTLAAGTEDFCAVLSTGRMTCWGYNGSGQLGNGYTGDYSDVPRAVKNIKTATAVTADETTGRSNSFCAMLSTRHVDCWGYGSDGELGDGTFSSSDVPVAVPAIGNAAAVTGSESGFCALLSTGHVDCWGYNLDGQLGNGTTTGSDVPVAVLAPN